MGVVAWIFNGAAALFGAWATKKVALAGAAVATFAALTLALMGALAALITGLLFSFPESGSFIETMLWLALPSNAEACLAICISADVAIGLYRWNVENIRLAAYVT